MSGKAPNGSPKGEKKGDDKIVLKVAGVVVATGIAWGLYKVFSRPDHPLVNTEKGVKKDAANALDTTKVICSLYLSEPSPFVQVLVDFRVRLSYD